MGSLCAVNYSGECREESIYDLRDTRIGIHMARDITNTTYKVILFTPHHTDTAGAMKYRYSA